MTKKWSGTLSGDYSSNSSSSNRRFMQKEGEKGKALTTYGFEDFEDFLEDFKDEHYQFYFDQDNLEFIMSYCTQFVNICVLTGQNCQ